MGNTLSHEQLASIRQRVLSAYNVPDLGEVARRVGVSYQKLQHYFIGRTPIPTVLLLRLSADTRVSIHWLLTGEGEKYPGINQAQSQQLGKQLDERRAKQRDIFDLVTQFNELPGPEKIALSNQIVGLVANYLLSACNIMEVEPAHIELIPIVAVSPNGHD